MLEILHATAERDPCGHIRVMVRCSYCQATKTVNKYSVKKVKSCGCLQRNDNLPAGYKTQRWYSTWRGMRHRCNAPSCREYKYYGGRGVAVCERWNKPENFYVDMGDPPDNTSLDRIDPEGNYEPGNCRWAAPAEQMRNRRDTKLNPQIVERMRRALARGWTRKRIHRELCPQITYKSTCRVLAGGSW